jgi:hypothetical protein
MSGVKKNLLRYSVQVGGGTVNLRYHKGSHMGRAATVDTGHGIWMQVYNPTEFGQWISPHTPQTLPDTYYASQKDPASA